MLSHSSPEIGPESAVHAAAIGGPDIARAEGADEVGGAAEGGGAAEVGTAGGSAVAHRIVALTAELATELSRFRAANLGPADLDGLMHGMSRTAAAFTRILDQLRECPVLAEPENELGLPRHHTVRSELEQAAAAAEDLQATAESLCRLLPAEVLGSNRLT